MDCGLDTQPKFVFRQKSLGAAADKRLIPRAPVATEYKIIGGDGREYGPASLEEIRDWIVDGRVDHSTMVWRSDELRWQPAGRWVELVWDLPTPPTIEPQTETAAEPPPLQVFIPAGFWVRIAAYCVDLLMVLVLLRFATAPFAEQMQDVARMIKAAKPDELMVDVEKLFAFYRAVLPMLFLQLGAQALISIAYFVGFNGRFGCTPGKWLVGIEIVNEDGSPLGYRRAFWRYSAEVISWLTVGFGYLMVAFSPDKRGLHDVIAKTRVIYRR